MNLVILRFILETPIDMGTYQRRFESLLHFEEIQMEVDIRKYDMDEVTMTTCPDYRLLLVLQVFYSSAFARPPIHLLHGIKSILCYEKEGPVSYE